MARDDGKPQVAFVLGGGGHLGAHEVGMLRALLEREVRPDLVLGTSVGALNGAGFAADPSLETVDRLESAWIEMTREDVFGSFVSGAATLVRTRTHLHSNDGLRDLAERLLPVTRFEELVIPFQCVAACIERAAEHWFDSGPLVPAILASAAVPGLLPPVEIDGEHYFDGGIVNSIPVGRAIELGATEIYVLHVGRIERPLRPPENVWEVGMVAFELARRHRFARDLNNLPPGVVARVLPTGEQEPPRYEDLSRLRYRDFSAVKRKIRRAYRASLAALEEWEQLPA
jgi:NTE family protein